MKVTYEQLSDITKSIEALNVKQIEETDPKLYYALIKNYKKIAKIMDKFYKREILQINLTYCLVDENNVPKKSDKNEFMISKDNIIKRDEEIEKAFNKEVDFEFYNYTLTPEVEQELGTFLVEEFLDTIFVRQVEV